MKQGGTFQLPHLSFAMARHAVVDLAQVLKRDPTENEISRLLEETPEAVRAAKQMSSTEVSLDAPIDRSDREASTLGERLDGVDG